MSNSNFLLHEYNRIIFILDSGHNPRRRPRFGHTNCDVRGKINIDMLHIYRNSTIEQLLNLNHIINIID